MKFKKVVALVASVACVGVLAACGETEDPVVDRDYNLSNPGELLDGFTSIANQNANEEVHTDGHYVAGGKTFWTKNTYRTTYSTEPTDAKFNYLVNSWTYNSYHYCNMVDGLVENDKYGNVVGALALGYKLIDHPDGTQSWQFQIRNNAEWVDNKTGKFYGKVTAEDFVTSAKYVLDPANGSETSYMYTSFVDGAAEYETKMAQWQQGQGEKPDFDEIVGIKAVAPNIIEYTTDTVRPYFMSCLTYSPYLPTNAAFLEDRGTDFGATVDDILVNGAFRITKHIYEVKMEYTKNYHYYDRGHVYFDYVVRQFVPSSADLSTTRTWYESDLIDGFTVQQDDEDGWDKYVVGPDGEGSLKAPANENCNSIQSYGDATYVGYFQVNRTSWEYHDYDNQKSGAEAITCAEKTADQKKATAEALFNVNFRKGVLYGLDALSYLKRFDSEEPYNYLTRSFTNKDLALYNGKDYTDYVNEIYNEEQGTEGVSLIGIDNGADPIYDANVSKGYFQTAYTELKAAGLQDSDFPIILDYLGSMNVKLQAYEHDELTALQKASVLANGTQVVKINYNVPASSDENTQWGSGNARNYDFSMFSGWGPDFADPDTYLACWKIYGNMVKYLGFPIGESSLATTTLSAYAPQRYQDIKEALGEPAAIQQMMNDVLGEYDEEYYEAAGIVDPSETELRFQKFAQAEYDLIYKYAIIVPWYQQSGYYATVSNTIPWQAGRATYGLTGDKFKNVVVTTTVMTQELRAAVTAEYEAGK